MKKEDIEPGDILSTKNGKTAYVIGIIKSGIRVYVNQQKDVILNEQLYHWDLVNPIKDNRLVSSYTFAIRFKQFLEWIPENWWMSQPHYFEEYEYMMDVAEKLLKYQIRTATDENEINYLKTNYYYDNRK